VAWDRILADESPKISTLRPIGSQRYSRCIAAVERSSMRIDFDKPVTVWELHRSPRMVGHAEVIQKTTYSEPGEWVFPSTRLDSKQPRVANMLVEDHLRPAAVKAGILSSHLDSHGRLVDDDPRRFGFHNLRHSLASFLIRIRTDPKTVQTLLRHSDVKLTLQFYTHAVSRDRMVAAGKMLTAILSHAPNKNGLTAD